MNVIISEGLALNVIKSIVIIDGLLVILKLGAGFCKALKCLYRLLFTLSVAFSS